MFDNTAKALNCSLDALDSANTQVLQTLTRLSDPAHRAAIVEEVHKELVDCPGLLDEVVQLLADGKEE